MATRICLLLLGFLTALLTQVSSANQKCQMELRVNDTQAKVSVGNLAKDLTVPMYIKCTNKQQVIKVKSRDGQEFVRTLANRKNFTKQDRLWNIVFLSPNVIHAEAKVISKSEEPKALNQTAVLTELVKIRQLFERIVKSNSNPTITKLANKKLQRVMSSVSRAGNIRSYAGYFVQLHAIMRDDYNTKIVENEMSMQFPKTAASDLMFCKGHHFMKAPVWTRVVVGPFKSRRVADRVRKTAGQGAFIHKTLSCLNKEAS